MLAPADLGVDQAALTALTAHDWHVLEQVDDPHAALVELCLGERASAARAAWGLDRAEPPALLVIEPGRWRELANLVAAVARYLPTIAIWRFADGELHQLQAATATAPAAVPAAAREPSLAASTTRSVAPALRLADAITDVDDAKPAAAAAPVDAVAELTAEEIRMLREPAPEEQQP